MHGVGEPSGLLTETHGLFKSLGVNVVQPEIIKNKIKSEILIVMPQLLNTISEIIS